jgi:hypothetical protein
MDVESRLRSAGLPDVSVDTEAALTSTKRHGRRRRQRRIGVLGAVSVALSLGLIAVVFGRGDDDSTQVATEGADVYSEDFAVSGRMVAVGGRADSGTEPARGTVQALDGTAVTVASTETDSEGRFELALPNGTYRLVGRSPLYRNGEVDCSAERDLLVQNDDVDGVIVECQRR